MNDLICENCGPRKNNETFWEYDQAFCSMCRALIGPKWQKDFPADPGWYRVLYPSYSDNQPSAEVGCYDTEHTHAGEWDGCLWDHRPIEFLPIPKGKS